MVSKNREKKLVIVHQELQKEYKIIWKGNLSRFRLVVIHEIHTPQQTTQAITRSFIHFFI